VEIGKWIGDTGLIVCLAGLGAFKTVFRGKVSGRVGDVLFLVKNALTNSVGGHEMADILKQIVCKRA
jgi:hypothetical protein